jgi:hypothetical protein
MGSPMKTKILAAIFCLALPLPAFAGWVGPKVVVSGTWGNGPNQFGIEHWDYDDKYPELLAISSSGKMIIGDELNKRIQIFSNLGAFERIITSANVPQKHQDTKWWPLSLLVCDDSKIISEIEEYTQIYSLSGALEHSFNNIEGGVIQFLNDCSFITNDPSIKKYFQYSPIGTLIQTYSTRPMELGVWSFTCKAGFKTLQKCNRLHFDIEYPDAVYIFEVSRTDYKSSLERQVKVGNSLIVDNQKGSVYAYAVTSTIPAVNGKKEKRYLGWKATWQKPEGDYSEKTVGIEKLETLIKEYGDPVVGPDGNIYCWMRSETHYKILKWSWKD